MNLLGVAYLVYDTVYRASAEIDVLGADNYDPFVFPFKVTNNSNLFDMYNIGWKCTIVNGVGDFGNNKSVPLENIVSSVETTDVVRIGNTLNYFCSPLTSNTLLVKKMIIETKITFETHVFGIFPVKRHPNPVRFTWIANSKNPAWVKGEFGRRAPTTIGFR